MDTAMNKAAVVADLTMQLTEITSVVARDRVSAIERDIEAGYADIAALSWLFAASEFVERDEFAEMAAVLLKGNGAAVGYPGISAVTPEMKSSYEADVRADGIEGYTILERNSSGDSIPVLPRGYYYPVFYIEPVRDGSPQGLDVGAASDRHEEFALARDTGEVVATAVRARLGDSQVCSGPGDRSSLAGARAPRHNGGIALGTGGASMTALRATSLSGRHRHLRPGVRKTGAGFRLTTGGDRTVWGFYP